MSTATELVAPTAGGVGLRDRALIAVMPHTFARVSEVERVGI
jgi:hypothetical protein